MLRGTWEIVKKALSLRPLRFRGIFSYPVVFFRKQYKDIKHINNLVENAIIYKSML